MYAKVRNKETGETDHYEIKPLYWWLGFANIGSCVIFLFKDALFWSMVAWVVGVLMVWRSVKKIDATEGV